MEEFKNNLSGPLMGTDNLGRTTADNSTAPAPRKDRLVGLFYFLWLGEHGRHKPYDISKITAADPQAGYHPDSPEWGGVGVYHYWGEPLYGYYYSNDEWVIRKHMKLIIQADIDFLFFDTTNAATYDENVKIVMRVLDEYRQDGWKIPKVMFYTNTKSGETVQHLYETIYKPQYCPETWFYFEGKPVIIAVKEECSPEAREFFNIKMSQWPNEPDKLGGWPWMDFTRPQRVFANLKGEPEVINVSVAQHPQLRFGDSVLYGEKGNCGRAYHNGENDPNPEAYKYGYNFAEQFDRAIEADPPIVLVTGWNEWIAGRWEGIPERPIMFVDCANYEYSRDIEMMKGGYSDNFFMQLVDYVRRYKGVGQNKVYGTGEEAEFDSFSDGDFARNAEGAATVYKNFTQRNAITKITVKSDDRDLTFKITAKDDIKQDKSGTWFRIYINTDGGKDYSYILNNTPDDGGKTTLAKVSDCLDGEDIAEASYSVEGNTLTVKVKKSDLGLEDSFTLWFKVADSTEEIKTFENFYELGDVAPLGRLNYVYKTK